MVANFDVNTCNMNLYWNLDTNFVSGILSGNYTASKFLSFIKRDHLWHGDMSQIGVNFLNEN